MADVPGVVHSGMSMLRTYGLPIAGAVSGWFMGDFGLKDFLAGVIPVSLGDTGVSVLAGALLMGVGLALWSLVPYVGGFVGAMLITMGAKTLLNSVKKPAVV